MGMATGPGVSTSAPHQNPLGRHTEYLQESGSPLTLEEAIAAYREGTYSAAVVAVPDFGIGAPPVWIRLGVENPTTTPVWRRLSVTTSWLDRVDIYVRHGDETVASHQLGDKLPFRERPLDDRGFAIEHPFAPGFSEVYLRVETVDPMLLAIYLETRDEAAQRETLYQYGYGFLYGFMGALLVYNVMLFIGLRMLRYLLYSVYLGTFLLLNISYTGHGFKLFWPDSTVWTQWAQPVFLVLYAAAGLVFALSFLDTRSHFPRAHRVMVAGILFTVTLLALSILLGRQELSLLVAFVTVTGFTLVMVVLGGMSVRAGLHAARYFLAAAVCAMFGAATSSLAVWGLIPVTRLTYHAVDVGMLLEATLLALALSYQFQLAQRERDYARRQARIDPLTNTCNRRAFHDLSAPVWRTAVRYDRPLSLILLDLDHFKRINDTHGHACGDEVLKFCAGILQTAVREQDVVSRWGGEEFLVLLPETDVAAAIAMAERLRTALKASRVKCGGAEIEVTASLGVAGREGGHKNIEALISLADKHLYTAKSTGRNRVYPERVEPYAQFEQAPL